MWSITMYQATCLLPAVSQSARMLKAMCTLLTCLVGTQKNLSTKLRTDHRPLTENGHHPPEKAVQNIQLNFFCTAFFSIAIVFCNNSQGMESLLAFKKPVRSAIKVMKILFMVGG